jgi:hypothetical protein
MEQGPAYDAHGTEMAPLRTWMLAKLLWNPDLDDRALMEEFLNGYYGAAGPHLLAYLDVIHDAVAARGSAYRLRPHLGYKQAAIDFLNFEVLREARAHLKAAEAAAQDRPELAARVRLAEMPFLYTVIMTWTDLKRQAEVTDAEWFLEEPVDALFARFKETAATNGVTRLTEFGRAGFGEIDTAVGAALQAEAAEATPAQPEPVQ